MSDFIIDQIPFIPSGVTYHRGGSRSLSWSTVSCRSTRSPSPPRSAAGQSRRSRRRTWLRTGRSRGRRRRLHPALIDVEGSAKDVEQVVMHPRTPTEEEVSDGQRWRTMPRPSGRLRVGLPETLHDPASSVDIGSCCRCCDVERRRVQPGQLSPW